MLDEFNVRLRGTHEYASVEAIPLSTTCALFSTHDGKYDVLLILPGFALGLDTDRSTTCRKFVIALEQAGVFLGDPDISVIFERNGGRTAFLETLVKIGQNVKETEQ